MFTGTTRLPRKLIWRGQRRSDWSLETSLDRLFGKLGMLSFGPSELERLSGLHLEAFKYAARGRRGQSPPRLDPNEWWSLGQHYGLATPLLDWSRSPFAAAYFAFDESASDPTSHRVVYALDQSAVEFKNDELQNGVSLEIGRLPIIEFIEPLSDENPRLVSQGGLFTRSPISVPIESWVLRAFEGIQQPILRRIEIPDADRGVCLSSLDRMNINHLSLFPDLSGASRFANLKLELKL